MTTYATDTSRWSMAIHRVSTDSAEIWVGTLFPTLIMPRRARVRLFEGDNLVRTKTIKKSDWKRPFSRTKQRFYALLTFTGLEPGKSYSVRFDRFAELSGLSENDGWQHLRNGYFDTLPARLPLSTGKPFTIGLGSCFYNHRDGGQAAGAYQALYERGQNHKPDITFLTGDQVYLDIGFDSLSLDADEIRQRIGDDYAEHWRALGGILNRGGTWMLPDDHEYWNDYPFYDGLIPQLLALKLEKVRKVWSKAAKEAVKRVQRSSVVEQIAIGKDLSFCIADLRSYRSRNRFIGTADFDRIIAWAETLKCPGILVSPQPLLVETSSSERNLRSFEKQYVRLLEALASSGHDIMVLSGDVHFGRIATCKLGNNGAKLIEVVSSPLSNLTYLNGIATSTPSHVPGSFPPKEMSVQGWPSSKVNYASQFDVSTKKGWLFSAYPKARTREHFMTVSLQRTPDKGVNVTVDAWRVRERTKQKNLPVKDFSKPFKVTLS
ncbi:hypothetical protein MIB92_19060 [Aestuariirhabdus sp. Z084]|uniref:hypothetical protein n=1 Tax=Aestuariirhabdus haliotis TaxID=2918751 RepID=UPI00201B407D|nr:hypothetical protein [Aestuariirhabdus haliotis]MCL6417766.1 hypothetical protein [Aestuariirhabdus haliotis]MCL6421695.1 hypothetical protein [Aestuariirhabdus haliotis]